MNPVFDEAWDALSNEEKDLAISATDNSKKEFFKHIISKQLSDDHCAEKAFTGESNYGAFVDHDYYFLRAQIDWIPKPDDPVYSDSITIPHGFVTDFASIPRMAWALIPKDGKHTIPSILHDWLYWEQDDITGMTRDLADSIYNEAMKVVGVKTKYRAVIYNSVKHFGGDAWKKNKEAKINGESRMLAVISTDVNTSWKEWKEIKSNFLHQSY